jgi:hypothetical protein
MGGGKLFPMKIETEAKILMKLEKTAAKVIKYYYLWPAENYPSEN